MRRAQPAEYTVVDTIAAVETTRRAGHADVPVEPVIIERVEVVAAAQ